MSAVNKHQGQFKIVKNTCEKCLLYSVADEPLLTMSTFKTSHLKTDVFRKTVCLFSKCNVSLITGGNTLIIPEELPSILSVIYSNIPPIKKGLAVLY
jgi:hypothetical protein